MASYIEGLGRRHMSAKIDDEVQRQKAEHDRWKQTDGFNLEALAYEPSRAIRWMMQQRAYLKPIYDSMIGQMPPEELTDGKIDFLGNFMFGRLNEVMSFFNQSGQAMLPEIPTEMLLGRKSTRTLIKEATTYMFNNHDFEAEIDGLVIGRYDPDWIRIALGTRKHPEITRLHRAKAVGETSTVGARDSQKRKSKFLEVGRRHYKPLLVRSTKLEFTVPKGVRPDNYPGVVPVKGQHTTTDVQRLMEQFYYGFRPGNNALTLVEICPELERHQRFNEDAPEVPLLTRLAQTYTPA